MLLFIQPQHLTEWASTPCHCHFKPGKETRYP